MGTGSPEKEYQYHPRAGKSQPDKPARQTRSSRQCNGATNLANLVEMVRNGAPIILIILLLFNYSQSHLINKVDQAALTLLVLEVSANSLDMPVIRTTAATQNVQCR